MVKVSFLEGKDAYGKKFIIDRSRPFDSIARIDMKKCWFWGKKKNATLIVNRAFLDYLKEFVLDDEERNELLKSVVSQAFERYCMQTDKNHPFYGDEAGFEHYCREKYKKLYDHINRMIDNLQNIRQMQTL